MQVISAERRSRMYRPQKSSLSLQFTFRSWYRWGMLPTVSSLRGPMFV